MNMTVALAILWVIASSIVACLPMHHQFRPGALLLLAAPAMIFMLAVEFGPMAGLFATAAFVSMFRHPLRYLWGKIRDALGARI